MFPQESGAENRPIQRDVPKSNLNDSGWVKHRVVLRTFLITSTLQYYRHWLCNKNHVWLYRITVFVRTDSHCLPCSTIENSSDNDLFWVWTRKWGTYSLIFWSRKVFEGVKNHVRSCSEKASLVPFFSFRNLDQTCLFEATPHMILDSFKHFSGPKYKTIRM